MLDELVGGLFVDRVVFGEDEGHLQHVLAVDAIQAVPSACSREPPVGSGALRSKTPMLSRPRNPPAKTLRPVGSLRLTDEPKFSINPGNDRSRNLRSARPSVRSVL